MLATETCLTDCPYCGENIEVVVDTSLEYQEYIEDCFVCCRPIVMKISIDDQGEIRIISQHENDT